MRARSRAALAGLSLVLCLTAAGAEARNANRLSCPMRHICSKSDSAGSCSAVVTYIRCKDPQAKLAVIPSERRSFE